MVEATGPLAILFAILTLLAGPFMAQQLFIASMSYQLEKLQNDGSVDLAKKIVMQWLQYASYRAFTKWKAHWYERDMRVMKKIMEHLVQHREQIEWLLLRWIANDKGLLAPWNAWVGMLQDKAQKRQDLEMMTGQRVAFVPGQIVQGKAPRKLGVQKETSAIVAIAKSEILEQCMASLAMACVVLMSLQGS
jgi:phage/plasmid-associated DNA primase